MTGWQRRPWTGPSRWNCCGCSINCWPRAPATPRIPWSLPMVDFNAVRAIDIHTHAEEPCGTHADDGYDDFQQHMKQYFRMGHSPQPTVAETAQYFRERNIAACIFPVDAERETG